MMPKQSPTPKSNQLPSKKVYSREFKVETLQLLKSSGKTKADLERELGLYPGQIHLWKMAYFCQWVPPNTRILVHFTTLRFWFRHETIKPYAKAQARFLRAVEMLVNVRKLSKVTPLQINVAQQQVNVAKGEG